jgi:hypothetical protein
MANIFPDGDLEIADAGGAKILLVPDGPTGVYELWTRAVSFGATAPAFALKGVFGSLTTVTSGSLPIGALLQARLFGKNDGPDGKLLGTLDYPVLAREARADYLTACAEVPQVDITVGGTFASISFATNVKTVARVQLATSQPERIGDFPLFKPTDVVASATSLEPKLLHRVSLQDLLTDRETTGHSAMLSGAKLFFTILVWTEDGRWDYVWSPVAAAPGQAPDPIKLKGRRVGVRLVSLYCTDDSDSSTFGEAEFSMIVRDSTGADLSVPFTWNPMATDSFSPTIPPGTADIILMPPKAAGRVSVRISAVEDDSGTPFDDDDSALAGGVAGTRLSFPAGEGKELVTGQVLNLDSDPSFAEGDDNLAFGAQLVFSVRYL